MNGGDGDKSYSANSLITRRVLSMTKPVLVKNTKEMFANLDFPESVKVADFGCSSGQNTFLVMSEIVDAINFLCQERNQKQPEIECCLNDLPSNDFNAVFKLIALFKKKVTSEGSCFISGVPASSPLSNYIAYLNQFQRDFSTFLKVRSEEMVSNGRVILTIMGRNTIDDPLYRDCCHCWTLLSNSLRDLVLEGLLSASKVNSFKIPFYDPTKEEVKEIIREEGSFQINDLETHGFDLGHSYEDCVSQSGREGQKEAGCIRAVTESMLVAHFGDSINIDTLFSKYAHHASQHASCKIKTTVTLVVSLIRK
ncbi:hypothetical protein HID58_046516 [Brassica napus]|uniref:Uncharacterized protein n=1 Tax=Brassica napus TaxID=3708 RepID=A0ABQ8AXQ0_BRANA|nr:hypothetical protein HID58_046516 [Brassica napus]